MSARIEKKLIMQTNFPNAATKMKKLENVNKRSEPPSFCACNLAPHLASSQPQIHIASSIMRCNNYGGSSTRIGSRHHQHQHHYCHQPQFYGSFEPFTYQQQSTNGSQCATMGRNESKWTSNGSNGVGVSNYVGGIRPYGTGPTANISTITTPSSQQQRVHTSTTSPL